MTTQLPPSLESCSPIVKTFLIRNNIPGSNSCVDVPYTVLTVVTESEPFVLHDYAAITFRTGLLRNTLTSDKEGNMVMS